MQAETLELARRAAELARSAGADHAVASVTSSRSLELKQRDGRVETVEESRSTALRIQLHVDGRFSTHATTDLGAAALASFVARGVAMTRLLERDPFRRPCPRELWEGRAELDLDQVDARIDARTNDERTALARAVEEAARADAAVLSATAHVSDGRVAYARVATDGFEGTTVSTSAALGAEVSVRDEGERRPEAYRFAAAAHLADLPDATRIGREALARALARRGARKAPSARTTMVLAPEAAGSFLRRVVGVLNAGAVQQRRCFLEGRLGEPIASPLLDLVDDPHRPRSFASRLFDGDGIATRRRPFVERGVLSAFFVDVYYGGKLGWAPTTTGPSNVLFQGGRGALADLVRGAGEGFLVNGFLGGNANPTTGDFSFGVHGHRIARGGLAEPIAEMNVSGNYKDVLARLVAVGDDPEPWSSFRSPTLVFEGVDFSGS
jgi:PmbA protein